MNDMNDMNDMKDMDWLFAEIEDLAWECREGKVAFPYNALPILYGVAAISGSPAALFLTDGGKLVAQWIHDNGTTWLSIEAE